MRDEIIGGIKNAVDRGSSINEAAKSFVNAGYSKIEVTEAVKKIAPNAVPGLNLEDESKPANQKDVIKAAVQGNDDLAHQKAQTATTNPPAANTQAPQTATTNPPTTAPQTATTNPPTTAPQTPPPANSPTTNTQAPQVNMPNSQTPKPKSNKKTIIVLIIIFLVLLVGLGVTILFGEDIVNSFS